MQRTLLLISSLAEDLAFATEVAKAANLTLLHAQDAKLGVSIILDKAPSTILVDASTNTIYQAFENEVQERVGLFSDRISANSIHFIAGDDLEKNPYLVQSPLFGNFLTRNFAQPAECGAHYGRVILHSFSRRAFGLQGLLAPNTKIQVVKLALSTQKGAAVDAVKNFALAAKFQARMASTIATAVDEIIMNAMFDAPTDEMGRPLFKVTARTSQVKLEEKNAVEMHIGFDNKYLGVTAVDNFGSLDKVALLSHVSRVYRDDEYKVKSTLASAGIGLASIYRNGASLHFVSESRVRTEVTVLFKRTDNYRDFKDQFRFLSTQFYF